MRLQPSSEWNLDYAEDRCRLVRIFGEGDDETAFYIEQYAPSETFFMVAAGQPFKLVKRNKIELQFGPAADAQMKFIMGGNFGNFGKAVMIDNLSMVGPAKNPDYQPGAGNDESLPAERAPEAGISWLSFRKTGAKDLVLDDGQADGCDAPVRRRTADPLGYRCWEAQKSDQETRATQFSRQMVDP